MNNSMYQSSIPVFTHALNNLANILEKGAAHAEAKKIDPAVLINSRLYPDMFALVRQVQIACDSAKAVPHAWPVLSRLCMKITRKHLPSLLRVARKPLHTWKH